MRVDVWVEAPTEKKARSHLYEKLEGLRIDSVRVLYEQGAIRRAAEELWDAGIAQETFDEDVIDAATQLASNVNNEGFEGQIRFLAEQWGMKQALRLVREALHDLTIPIEEDDSPDAGK